jgi:hypothetical protein
LHVALLRGDRGRWEDRKTNLRAGLTSFVGRDADVAAVRGLIAGHRLTTGVVAELPRSTRLGPVTGLWHEIPVGSEMMRVHRRFFADIDTADATMTDAILPGATAMAATIMADATTAAA